MGVAVSASAAGLAVGTYMGSVTIASTGATDSPLTVNVTFDVTSAPPPAAPTLAASPKALTFTAADATSTVAPQTVQISMSDNSKLAITAKATTTSGGAWLSVAPTAGTTPQSLTVTVTPTGLASGKYSGTVTVAASGASNSPLSIPISLTVGTVTPPPTDLRSFSFHVLTS